MHFLPFRENLIILQYLTVVPIFIDLYQEGYLTDEEYESVEEKLVKECGINPLSVYRFKLRDAKGK